MKIAEVKVGEEYAAHDSPATRNSRDLPRQVKVLEIVSEKERRHGHYAAGSTEITKRKVKVEVLDAPRHKGSTWHRDKIKNADKGATLVVEARMLVAAWSDVRKDIAQAVEVEQKRVTLRDSLEARLDALGLVGRTNVSVTDQLRTNLTVFDTENVEAFIALAEAGKAAQS